MSSDLNFKKDGFEGQRAIVLPQSVLVKFCIDNEAIKGACVYIFALSPI
jgi:hypothetical protein